MPLKPVSSYQQLIFDCDGVLFDSNEIKAANIRSAAAPHSDEEYLDRFVRYFVEHNGVPRRPKVMRFFPDRTVANAILSRYADLNARTYGKLDVLPAAREFIEGLAPLGIQLYALTGGDQNETTALLERTGIASRFAMILGGPRTKSEHLRDLEFDGLSCFFGDSAHDYMVAESFGFDFVFLTRYTQMKDWAAFFKGRPGVTIAEDFSELASWTSCFE